jgi:hypothetical protein
MNRYPRYLHCIRTSTRVQFLKSRFQMLVVYVLVNDASSILIRADPRAYLATDSSPLAGQPFQP